MMNNKWILFLVFVLGLTSVAYYGINYFESKALPLPQYGEASHSIPDFEFQNQLDQTFNSRDHDGKIWIVDYFFTSCPSVCPRMTKNLQGVHDYIRGEKDIIILSFTVDPKRDTPERLLQFAERYNANNETWQFLTGSKKDLYRLARNAFLISATEGPGDQDDFIHSENIVVIDTNHNIRAIINGTAEESTDQIISAIKKIKKEIL